MNVTFSAELPHLVQEYSWSVAVLPNTHEGGGCEISSSTSTCTKLKQFIQVIEQRWLPARVQADSMLGGGKAERWLITENLFRMRYLYQTQDLFRGTSEITGEA